MLAAAWTRLKESAATFRPQGAESACFIARSAILGVTNLNFHYWNHAPGLGGKTQNTGLEWFQK